MIDNDIEKIIKEIFDPMMDYNSDHFGTSYLPPNFDDIKEIAELISKNENEETFQKFFNTKPNLLFRTTPASGDTVAGFLVKPPIGNFHKADFAVFTIGQGGCGITLIEIERPSDNLFTQKLTPAAKLQTALGQVDDWSQWINKNKSTFTNTSLELLQNAPLHPKKSANGSFKLFPNKNLKAMWTGFGGDEDCNFGYMVIIGRWSQLSDIERKRLLFYNKKNQPIFFQIKTYEQLIRNMIDGPSIIW